MIERLASARERILWSSEVGRIGRFDARQGDRDFEEAGQVSEPTLAFPMWPVEIRWRHRGRLLADVHLVVLHNVGDEYRREAVSREGDQSIWFHFSPGVIAEALEANGLDVRSDESRPFSRHWSPVDAETTALRAALAHHLESGESVDHLFIEESALLILGRALRTTDFDPAVGSSRERSRERDLAEGAQEIISRRWDRSSRLADIAEPLGVSIYHLCRVFRRVTGSTVHGHLRQVRLRRSLERVLEDRSDLRAVALDHGFSSHSHFTAAFRAAFGVTPSAFRELPSSSSLRTLLSDHRRGQRS